MIKDRKTREEPTHSRDGSDRELPIQQTDKEVTKKVPTLIE